MQSVKMNPLSAILLFSLAWGACKSANVKNATLMMLPEVVEEVSRVKRKKKRPNQICGFVFVFASFRELFVLTEVLLATTGELLLRAEPPKTRGFSTSVEGAGATAPPLAITGAPLGWVHPSHGQHRLNWMDSSRTCSQSILTSTTGTLST